MRDGRNARVKGYALLFGAIVSELVATANLKLSEGFSRAIPSAFVIVGYGLAFYLLSQTLKYLPLGLTYAIWSGIGTLGAVLISVFLFKDPMSTAQYVGAALVLIGVVLLNL